MLTLGQASPFFQALYEARVAAFIIWKIIDEVFEIFIFQYINMFMLYYSRQR